MLGLSGSSPLTTPLPPLVASPTDSASDNPPTSQTSTEQSSTISSISPSEATPPSTALEKGKGVVRSPTSENGLQTNSPVDRTRTPLRPSSADGSYRSRHSYPSRRSSIISNASSGNTPNRLRYEFLEKKSSNGMNLRGRIEQYFVTVLEPKLNVRSFFDDDDKKVFALRNPSPTLLAGEVENLQSIVNQAMAKARPLQTPYEIDAGHVLVHTLADGLPSETHVAVTYLILVVRMWEAVLFADYYLAVLWDEELPSEEPPPLSPIAPRPTTSPEDVANHKDWIHYYLNAPRVQKYLPDGEEEEEEEAQVEGEEELGGEDVEQELEEGAEEEEVEADILPEDPQPAPAPTTSPGSKPNLTVDTAVANAADNAVAGSSRVPWGQRDGQSRKSFSLGLPPPDERKGIYTVGRYPRPLDDPNYGRQRAPLIMGRDLEIRTPLSIRLLVETNQEGELHLREILDPQEEEAEEDHRGAEHLTQDSQEEDRQEEGHREEDPQEEDRQEEDRQEEEHQEEDRQVEGRPEEDHQEEDRQEEDRRQEYLGTRLWGHQDLEVIEESMDHLDHLGHLDRQDHRDRQATLRIDTRTSDVPKWDGHEDTFVDYFQAVQDFTKIHPHLADELAEKLPENFVPGSEAARWWSVLASDEVRERARQNLEGFFEEIRTQHLPSDWESTQQDQYELMRFRESGHTTETPTEFLTRRMIRARMLFNVEGDERRQIQLLLRGTPSEWQPILRPQTMLSVDQLVYEVRNNHGALIAARSARTAVNPDRQRRQYYFNRHTVNEAEADLEDIPEQDEDDEMGPGPTAGHSEEEYLPFEGNLADIKIYPVETQEAYLAVDRERRQRRPPVGGYPFPKDDHVKTQRSSFPPSPCRWCGSAMHWDAECQHHTEGSSRENQKKLVVRPNRSRQAAAHMKNIYNAVLNLDTRRSYFESELVETDLAALQAEAMKASSEPCDNPRVEEVEDEERLEDEARSSLAVWYAPLLLEANLVRIGPPTEEEFKQKLRGDETASVPFLMEPSREHTPGTAAKGVPVLVIPGSLVSPDGAPINLRLDSGANLSLISESLYKSLGEYAPALCKGMRLSLMQLTSSDVKVLGYVTVPLFCRTDSGRILEFELEAYVIRNMTAPLLLGEDFQRLYDISVRRKGGQATIHFEGSQFSISASKVDSTLDDDVGTRAKRLAWPPSKTEP
ncbi:hypothetical protein PENSPDRAFT_737843 [Peniophora sp. CONT]|nr:hypothetical protein PENSPDRAFT_737843 [Peniophora sp. CONT]